MHKNSSRFLSILTLTLIAISAFIGPISARGATYTMAVGTSTHPNGSGLTSSYNLVAPPGCFTISAGYCTLSMNTKVDVFYSVLGIRPDKTQQLISWNTFRSSGCGVGGYSAPLSNTTFVGFRIIADVYKDGRFNDPSGLIGTTEAYVYAYGYMPPPVN